MEHGGGAHPGTEVLGVRGNGQQRLGGGAEQQVVDRCLVVVGNWANLGRQRKDQVEVADRQQIGRARGEPVFRCRALALGTMAVAARVVGNPAVAESSQRSTWPPRVAERHCSIAVITLSWPRLTCPALARRQAAPWR